MNTLLITAGQFFVLTQKAVFVEVLSDMETTSFWQGLRLADDANERNREHLRAGHIRATFGKDAVDFIPATSVECLLYYTEHYEGMHAELVKGLAACILTGTPWGGSETDFPIDGGLKVAAPKPPIKPRAPAGATFEGTTLEALMEKTYGEKVGVH